MNNSKYNITGKFFFCIAALFCFCTAMYAQAVTESSSLSGLTLPKDDTGNNIIVTTYRGSGLNSKMKTVTWFDDFGRQESVHQVAASPTGKSLVSLTEYDGCGRVSRQWLPATAEPKVLFFRGKILDHFDSYVSQEDIITGASSTNGGDGYPYSETVYDNSPLERLDMEYGPGESWREAARNIKTQYLSNNATEGRLVCHRLSLQVVDDDTTLTVKCDGPYADGTLRVVSVTDEDGSETLTFTDRLGRNILVRKVMREGTDVQYLDTYSLYDGLDRLRAVVPPALSVQLAVGQMLDLSEMEKYAYLYLYDAKDRVCAKKIPGTEWVRMTYDDADNIVLTQDGEQRRRGESTFLLYDKHGRECVRGVCSHDIESGDMFNEIVRAEYVGSDGALDGYNYSGVTLVSPKAMSASYYDTYDFVTDLSTGLPDSLAMYGNRIISMAGQQTGSCQYEMSENISNNRVWMLKRHDALGRVAHVETLYPGGDSCIEDVENDFLGSPTHRHIVHNGAGASTTTEDLFYTYDHSERLKEVRHSLNGKDTVLLVKNTYDELGRISATSNGTSSDLGVSYGYNVRSWLKSINGSLFCEKLYYNDLRSANLGEEKRRFDGNISSIEWRTGKGVGYCSYDYCYDDLGRLLSAEYGENGKIVDGYSASYSYDIMGNILSLSRYGDITPETKGTVANLVMTYDGNRLQSLTDGLHAVNRPDSEDSGGAATTVDGYSYDLNGNMTNEPGCGIVSISYNRNNQPAEITCLNSVESLTYLPDGTKLRRSVLKADNTLSTTEYRGNLVYENDSLRYVLVDGGLIDMNYSEPQYQFFLKDHLGGTRVVAKANGTVVQMDHYYPYGGSFADNRKLAFPEAHQTLPGIGDILEDGDNKVNLDNVSKDDSQLTIYDKSTASGFTTSGDSGDGAVIGGAVPEENGSVAMGYSRQPYRFSGNELYSETGLYDFRARQYSPSIARFFSIDPMAEKYCSVSPYSYCAGNPVKFVDPEGKFIKIVYKTSHGLRSFKYTGRETNLPNDTFVRNVVSMYQYNKSNWEKTRQTGTCPSTSLVESSEKGLYVYEYTGGETRYERMNGGIPRILLNPYAGSKTDKGIVMSPATIFSHEADHAIDDLTDNKAHVERREADAGNYSNAEEKRVISGSEQKMAKANGEITSGVTRKNHNGTTVYTTGPTTNEIDPVATVYYHRKYRK